MYALRWALHRFREISWLERCLLSEAFALLPVVHAAQQRLPFLAWRRLMERDLPIPSPRLGRVTPAQVVWAVDAACRWVPGEYKCLPRAYTTHLLLRHHAYPSQVHLGVSRAAEGTMDAHAWVECQGQIVVGQVEDMARFVPLPPLGQSSR